MIESSAIFKSVLMVILLRMVMKEETNFVCWTNTVYCYHFMAECLTIKYRLTFLLKYLFFRVADHLEPELV